MTLDPMDPSFKTAMDALTRWKGQPPITIQISRWEAYVLVGLLQLCTRHPGTTGAPLNIATSVGRQLQEAIADTPDVYNLLETGWDPTLDREAIKPQAGEDRA